jgi:hypothetical protein
MKSVLPMPTLLRVSISIKTVLYGALRASVKTPRPTWKHTVKRVVAFVAVVATVPSKRLFIDALFGWRAATSVNAINANHDDANSSVLFSFSIYRNVDMGVTQIIDAKLATEIQNRIAASQEYVNMISKDPQYKKLMELCKNNHESCAFWSVLGECEKNPGYMKTKCSPSCFSCDQLSVETRCPINLTETPNIWEPGDVNKFFTNLTTMDEYKQYGVKVLSAPDYLPGDSAEKEVDYLVNGPWAVLLENFISDEEADRLIELGAAEGYVRSSDVGKEKVDGTFDHHIGYGRTSHNSWCQKECYKDPVAQRVIERITNVTNIPEANSEYLVSDDYTLCITGMIYYICLCLLHHFWHSLFSPSKCCDTKLESTIKLTTTISPINCNDNQEYAF